jgi:hypothetical protein
MTILKDIRRQDLPGKTFCAMHTRMPRKIKRSELQSIAMQKTVKLTCPGDVHALMKFMPEDMIPNFVKARLLFSRLRDKAHGT